MSKGLSGLAVSLTLAGGIVAYSGVKGISVSAAIRNMLAGKDPSLTPQTLTIASNPALGGFDSSAPGWNSTSGVVAAAMKYNGSVLYKWGGGNPNGWDCSGFVNWVLGHDLGMVLPGGVKGFDGRAHGPIAAMYYVWSGAATVPRDQCQPGDLCCWMTHIGIAVDRDHMINAYTSGKPTEVTSIDSHAPRGESTRIRRLK